MKKLIMLFVLAITILNCKEGSQQIERSDILGVWKEVQGRITKNSPIKDIIVTDCENGSDVFSYNFKNDGIVLLKSTCPDAELQEEWKWDYQSDVLTLTTGNDNMKFSVSDEGENKIKLSSISVTIDGALSDSYDFGYFLVLEKK